MLNLLHNGAFPHWGVTWTPLLQTMWGRQTGTLQWGSGCWPPGAPVH